VNRRRFLLTASAGLALPRARPVSAAPVRLIPRRALFADPHRSQVRVSPDGKHIAFLAPSLGVLNLWIAPLSDVTKARALTQVSDRSIGFIAWLYDNRHIVFFRERAGDENWQAHSVNVTTGATRALTPGPGVRAQIQGISRHFPGEILLTHNERDKRYNDVYRVDAATGKSERIETNDRFIFYVTDPQFRVRLGARYTDDAAVEYFERTDAGAWESFARVEMADAFSTRALEYSDDGKELYWLDGRRRDKAAVVAQDLDSGSRRVLAEDAAGEFGWLMLDPLKRRPVASSVTYLKPRWEVLDPAYAADFAALTAHSPGDLGGVSTSADMRHWIAYYERDAAPARYAHYDRETRQVRPLFNVQRALDGAPLVPMQPVVIPARDGLELVCYLSRPRGSAAPGPMVLNVHGGPWGRDRWGLSSTHQWLANRGYAVLSVNFRGSTGFGKSFVNAANLEWGGKMHDDLIDAVDWAIARGVADPMRVAIYGASYGGYAALAGATFTPEKFACVVDIFGISHLLTFLKTIPPYWRPWQTIWKARMGDYTTEAGQKFLETRSPLNFVDRIVRPMLIVQGANDVRVTPSESDQIVAAMQKRNIPVTYVWYSDEGHGFRRAENRRSFYAVTELFLAKHLGGRAEPVGTDFKGSTIEFKAGRELIPGLG